MSQHSGVAGAKWTPEQKARRKLVGDAMRQARKLQRPDGVGKVHWRTVQDVLVELARHVPDIWPSQRYMETKLGLSRSAIRRAIDTAEKHDLVKRAPHPNAWRWDGVEYHLPWLVALSDVCPADDTGLGPPRGPSSGLPEALGRASSRPPMSSSLREEKQRPLSPSDSTNDDVPSSSSTSNPAEDEDRALALVLGPALAPGEIRVWESERLSLGLQHEPDASGWCEPCQRKHNQWTAPEGCSRCGCELEALQGYLDGKLPICEDCDLPRAAKRQRDADRARLREIKQFEYQQISADAIRWSKPSGLGGYIAWPEGYVFPNWHHQYKSEP